MTDRVIFDGSFGHAEITPAALKPTGADGVILYAGCNDARKNATKAEIQALLAAGYQVGLVVENVASDAIGGAAVGAAQGAAILAGAKSVGYDWRNCVLFGGYDTDSHSGDWARLLAYMEAFAVKVPVPGYYGDSDSIDYLHARHPDWIFWQSNSRSFSPLNPSPNTHLQQLYNDPRAHGLPVDVNIVRRTPLRLMGEDMPLTDADIAKIWEHPILADNQTPPVTWQAQHVLQRAYTEADAAGTVAASALAQVKSLQTAVAALQTAVAALQPSAALGGTATVQIDLAAK
jgi:hypothetical protein